MPCLVVVGGMWRQMGARLGIMECRRYDRCPRTVSGQPAVGGPGVAAGARRLARARRGAAGLVRAAAAHLPSPRPTSMLGKLPLDHPGIVLSHARPDLTHGLCRESARRRRAQAAALG